MLQADADLNSARKSVTNAFERLSPMSVVYTPHSVGGDYLSNRQVGWSGGLPRMY